MLKLIIAQGVEGPSVYLNGYRIAGPKPWGGSTSSKEFSVTDRDIREALRGTCLDIDNNALLARVVRLEEFLARMVYTDRGTWEKDGTDIFEAFRTDARTILEEDK